MNTRPAGIVPNVSWSDFLKSLDDPIPANDEPTRAADQPRSLNLDLS